MGDKTHIAWCDSTWNWAIGCTKVSPGCKNCYAENSPPVKFGGIIWGDTGRRRIAADATFNAPLRWNKKPWVCDLCGAACQIVGSPADLRAWCHSCGNNTTFHRRRVFSLSLGDWLDPKVSVEALARMLDIIRRCPSLDFLLLTKRPQLWKDQMWRVLNSGVPQSMHLWLLQWVVMKMPPSNVWLGTSVEDQQRADERIPELLKIPAKVRFLSVEPMFGAIQFRTPADFVLPDGGPTKCGIHWAIVGGESGPRARPCNIDWIRGVKDQCKAAGVACFVKQLGSKPVCDCSIAVGSLSANCCEHFPFPIRNPKGGDTAEWPEDLRVREFPK